MSSLWTPGGEVPIDRSGPAEERTGEPAAEPTGDGGSSSTAEAGDRERSEDYERMRRQVLEARAADVVAQHAVAFYELAALHLSEPEPRLSEARLAIDALAALVEGLSGRLGEAEQALADALPQLKMAYVEAADGGS